MKNLKSGALIAVAAGSLFAAACKKDDKAAGADQPATTQPAADKPADKPAQAEADKPAVANPEQSAKVDCAGVNECKGQGTCKTEKHGCGGQNECKGQGVLAMSEDDCKAKGGTVANKD